MGNRYREVWFFWRTHLGAILSVLIPVALIEAVLRLVLGEPITFDSNNQFQINWLATSGLLITRSLLEAQLLLLFARKVQQQNQDNGNLWPRSLQLLPLVVLANLLIFAAVGLGFTLLILPGIWLFVRLVFAQCFVVLQQQDPITAIRNSFRLSAGPVQWEFLPQWLLMVVVLQLPVLALSGLFVSLGLEEQTQALALLLPTLLLNSLPQVLIFRFYQLLTEPSS